ncbi:MAG: hypothetical protein Q8Q10_03775 [bacterium]|nr:hypothetical protein [bacterium]
MDTAGDEKSSGGSDLSEIKLKDGEIHLFNESAVKSEMSTKPAVESARPVNGAKVAMQQRETVLELSAEPGKEAIGNKITMADPSAVTEKRHLQLSALHLDTGDMPLEARSAYLKQLAKLQKRKRAATKEDVIKARSLRKGILGSIQQKKIDAAEQIRAAEEARLAEEEKLVRLEAFKNENPEYYEKYLKELDILENAFPREAKADTAGYNEWVVRDNKLMRSRSPEKRAEAEARQSLLIETGSTLERLIVEFNALDTRFPEDGLKGLLLFSEMQALVGRMPEYAQEISKQSIKDLVEEYGSEEPNAELIEKGHIQVLIKKELEVLKRNCEKVRERELFMTNTFGNIGQLEDHIQSLAALADSFDDETPIAEVEKTLGELQNLESGAFNDTPPERGNPFGKKAGSIRKLRDDKEVAGAAQVKKKFGEKRGDKRDQKRGNKRDLELDETSAGASQEPIPDRQAIDEKWREILAAEKTAEIEIQNIPISSERELALREIDRLLAEAQEAALVSNGKGMVSRMEVLQTVAKKIGDMFPQTDVDESPVEQSDDKELSKGGEISFESVVPENERQEIINIMQGYIDEGIEVTVSCLKDAGRKELGALFDSKDPEDIKIFDKEVQPLLDEISTRMLEVAMACGERIRPMEAESIASIIHDKGTVLLEETLTRVTKSVTK